MMNFIFGLQKYIKVFGKLSESLQYLQKNMGDEFAFLPEDKHKRFLQVDRFSLVVQI